MLLQKTAKYNLRIGWPLKNIQTFTLIYVWHFIYFLLYLVLPNMEIWVAQRRKIGKIFYHTLNWVGNIHISNGITRIPTNPTLGVILKVLCFLTITIVFRYSQPIISLCIVHCNQICIKFNLHISKWDEYK